MHLEGVRIKHKCTILETRHEPNRSGRNIDFLGSLSLTGCSENAEDFCP